MLSATTRVFVLVLTGVVASACSAAGDSDAGQESTAISGGDISNNDGGVGDFNGAPAAAAGGSQGVDGGGILITPGAGTGGTASDRVVVGVGGGSSTQAPVVAPSLPEEIEAPAYRAPVVTGNYLWSTNPDSGKVALIDASSLSTRVLSAGLRPTHLVAVPSEDFEAAAIVLNTGTSDASYFRVGTDGVSTTRIDVHVGANRWEISSSGRWAVAWSQNEAGDLDPTDGLQELTLIDLSQETPVPRRVTVGYRPQLVVFDDQEEELIVVSQLGVSLLELGSEKVRWVPLTESDNRDVSITEDGAHALINREASNIIEVVALDGSGDFMEVVLPGVVTDLDITGKGRAIAVVREAAMVILFDANKDLESEEGVDRVFIEGEIVGSAEVSENGEKAVLYTTAGDTHRVTVLNLEEGDEYLDYRSLDTQNPVQSVSLSPGGAYAISVGKGIEGASSGAFALLSLDEVRFPRVVGTLAPVKHVFVGDTAGVVTATSTQGVHEAHLVSLSGLHVETVPLASAPLSAGVLSDLELGFTAQDHPEGRVTFFEFGASNAQTLTGFELSSEIVEE